MSTPATAPGATQASTGAGYPADTTVVFEDVHLTYEIGTEIRRPTLRRWVVRAFQPRPTQKVQALRGVSFTLRQGDSLGILGPNGAGKSTLLRVLAGLLPPRQGRVLASSYPVMLGVNAAMHPELSGRRNIVLGATALGMSRGEVEERMDEVIAFAGLEEFIDMPMRAYSSGMKARLRFSVASAVNPEILLIDEALAVGDRQFKKRSRNRIMDMIDEAGTLVLVSHALGKLRDLCDRGIWLDHGRIIEDGPIDEVVDAYEAAEDDD